MGTKDKHLKSRLSTRIALVIAITVCFLGALHVSYSSYRLYQNLRNAMVLRVEKNAQLLAQTLALPVWDLDRAQIASTTGAYADHPDLAGLTVIDDHGHVLANHGDSELGQIIERPILFRVREGEKSIGKLRLVINEARVHEMFERELFSGLALNIVFVIAIVSFLSWALRFISSPIHALSEAMSRYARGDKAVHVEYTDRTDEIGMLAQSFLSMKRDLDELHDNLERKVSERTQELESATRRLREKTSELGEARDAAEAAAKTKSLFLANMSHELRTPLNGVIGASTLLLETALTDDQRELATMAKLSAETLLEVVNDVLDFSKIEAGKLGLSPVAFRVRDVLTSIEQMVSFRAREKGLTLVLGLDADVPLVLIGDPVRLKQVLLNLITNALKFTEAPGKVTIEVSVARKAARERAMLTFRVGDTGIGIAPEKLSTIFQPFTQADLSHTRLYGGTGLGLSICSQILSLMDGTISVESIVGKGTIFTVTVPFVVPNSVELSNLERAGERTKFHETFCWARPLQILLAEDHVINQRLATRLLEKDGHRVTVANNGKEAVDLNSRESFDLILMDIQMPVMNGEEAVQFIRETEAKSGTHVPIIALTAHALGGDREKYLALGMDGYVTKPIKRETLVEEIIRVLDGRG